MLLLTLSSLALAQTVPQVDLDGDGKVDTITVTEEGVAIAGHTVACGGMDLCRVELRDVSSADAWREVQVVELGPRDDAAAWLYRLHDGKLVELSFRKTSDTEDWQSRPSNIVTSGNGIVLAEQEQRLYTRREKYVASGDQLTHVPQPFWFVDYAVHVDRTFPIRLAPGSETVVANVKPDSDVRLVLESVERPGWFLVHISSGLTGWADIDALMSGSNQVMGIMGAG